MKHSSLRILSVALMAAVFAVGAFMIAKPVNDGSPEIVAQQTITEQPQQTAQQVLDTLEILEPAAGENAAEETEAEEEAPAETETAEAEAPAESAEAEEKTEEAASDGPNTNSDGSMALSDEEVQRLLKDRTMGDPEAPVKLVEYASMTCPHCANFHQSTFPRVKKELIDTGKLHYTYRDFPWDDLARIAGVMARCAPEDRYFQLIEVLFKDQERWIGSDDPLASMAQIGRLAGLKEENFVVCANDETVLLGMLKMQREAQTKYEVKATPTFVFNDGEKVFSGSQAYEVFEQTVELLMK